MRQHKIEETFRAIRGRRRGAPKVAPIIISKLSASGGGGSNATYGEGMSQAAQEIVRLRLNYEGQAVGGTSVPSGSASTAAGGNPPGLGMSLLSSVTDKVGLGALKSIFPLFSGIADLFGGGSTTPPPLNYYTPPPSISISDTLWNQNTGGNLALRGSAMVSNNFSTPEGAKSPISPDSATALEGSRQAAGGYQPQVTIQIHALDSQSILDRSGDIANAVRDAVLNLHPLNSVIAGLRS